MSSPRLDIAVALGATVAALCGAGCRKPDSDPRETSRTEVRAAESPSMAPTTSTGPSGRDDILRVRKEQLELRGRLQAEIDSIDTQLHALKVEVQKDGGVVVDPKSPDAARVKALLDRRARLVSNAGIVDRSDEHSWDAIKSSVERDLEKPHGGT